MDDCIPVQQLNSPDDRMTKLIKLFRNKYNHNARFIVKVPGRVNLVGEHVDDSGFPVISMAIEQNISIAVSYERNNVNNQTSNDKLNFAQINLSNIDQNAHPNHLFTDAHSLDDLVKPEWYHYVICGYKGIMESSEKYFENFSIDTIKQIINSFTIQILVSGDIPQSSGLSSSSALLVASAIAFQYCLGSILSEQIRLGELQDTFENDVNQFLKIRKHEMASNCAYYERYIGTQGGGIDQAIQLLAEHGTAKLIKFIPKLEAINVELPADCEFFILHCGKTLNKASTIHFNIRVFETRVAAHLLKKQSQMTNSNNGQQQSLNDIKGKVLLSDFETKNDENPYYDLVEQVTDLFSRQSGRMTINEIEELLDVDSHESLSDMIAFPLKSLHLILESNGDEFKFNLIDRALHVYNEVNRVLKMQSIDSTTENDSKINLIGQLLNESHQSLKDLYECSCDELDKLVELLNAYGAKGAKLTGAGWAGCLVAIVPVSKVEEYEKNLSSHCKFMIKTKANQGTIIHKIQ